MGELRENRVIVPTVGRVVLFWPKGRQQKEGGEQPCAAQVAHVHDDRKVNLGYMTPDGQQWPRVGVPLRQPDDEAPEGEFCEWMEFQVSQATSKTEDVIGKLADRFDALVARVADERQWDKERADELTTASRLLGQSQVANAERIAALELAVEKLIDELVKRPAPLIPGFTT